VGGASLSPPFWAGPMVARQRSELWDGEGVGEHQSHTSAL